MIAKNKRSSASDDGKRQPVDRAERRELPREADSQYPGDSDKYQPHKDLQR